MMMTRFIGFVQDIMISIKIAKLMALKPLTDVGGFFGARNRAERVSQDGQTEYT